MSAGNVRTHSLCLLGHEVLCQASPQMAEVIRRLTDDARARRLAERGALTPLTVAKLSALAGYAKKAIWESILETGSEEQGLDRVATLSAHLHYAVNFELNRRKVFWADDSLVWMLLQTNLDIEGRALELPFPAFALALQDEASADLMRAHLAKDTLLENKPPAVDSFTVYVMRGERTETGDDLDLAFVVGGGRRELPCVIGRSLHIRPDDDLEQILASSGSLVARSGVRDQGITPELTRLTHLVINAVLYATSAVPDDGWPVTVAPATAVMNKARALGAKRQRRAATRAALLSSSHSNEATFHLPGKISISRFRALKEAERHDAGGEVFSRFMVRGHWRRPNPTWTDQRLRWIEPYWKGPEMAHVIEREYRMAL